MSNALIRLEQVAVTFAGQTVLDNIELSVEPGQIVTLIGPNGAGKTTLLMMIARLLEPSGGDILLEGRNVRDIATGDYARRVATLRQAPDFNLRLTVEELVAFGRFPYSRGALTREDQRVIDEAIAFLTLQPLRTAYLDELSGGQRQMAFLAMTIAQQTDYLLLDEPLNNLDIKHAVQIMRALRALCDEHGRTVILVVHDINFAANYSDHIVAMKQGRVQCAGSVAQVLTEARLRALYELDFSISQDARGWLCNYFNPA